MKPGIDTYPLYEMIDRQVSQATASCLLQLLFVVNWTANTQCGGRHEKKTKKKGSLSDSGVSLLFGLLIRLGSSATANEYEMFIAPFFHKMNQEYNYFLTLVQSLIKLKHYLLFIGF